MAIEIITELKIELDENLEKKLREYQKNNDIETLSKATISFLRLAMNEFSKN